MTFLIEYYQSGTVTVIHGGCLSALPHIPDETIDLVFADPPYNIGKKIGKFHDSWNSISEYTTWCQQWLNDCLRILKPAGSLYVMTSIQSMPFLDMVIRAKRN